MTASAPFLAGVRLRPEAVPAALAFPFTIPALRDLDLALDAPVTFLVGENGSGKSTLLEGIAAACRVSPLGGGLDDINGLRADPAALTGALRLSFHRRPRDVFFFRAESLVQFALLLEAREEDPDFVGDPFARYGGRSLHARSHGEAFLATIQGRMEGGLWLFDEPEAALSPARQLALLALLYQRVQRGATQLIVATHSPILMTFPGATILQLDADGIRPTALEDTDHYQTTLGVLRNPEQYWRHLREE